MRQQLETRLRRLTRPQDTSVVFRVRAGNVLRVVTQIRRRQVVFAVCEHHVDSTETNSTHNQRVTAVINQVRHLLHQKLLIIIISVASWYRVSFSVQQLSTDCLVRLVIKYRLSGALGIVMSFDGLNYLCSAKPTCTYSKPQVAVKGRWQME